MPLTCSVLRGYRGDAGELSMQIRLRARPVSYFSRTYLKSVPRATVMLRFVLFPLRFPLPPNYERI